MVTFSYSLNLPRRQRKKKSLLVGKCGSLEHNGRTREEEFWHFPLSAERQVYFYPQRKPPTLYLPGVGSHQAH